MPEATSTGEPDAGNPRGEEHLLGPLLLYRFGAGDGRGPGLADGRGSVPERRPDLWVLPAPGGSLAIVLNMAYIRESFLPELLKEHFG